MTAAPSASATQQWLVAVALTTEAEELAQRGTAVTNAMAVSTAATVVEVVVSMFAARSHRKPRSQNFNDVLPIAASVSRMKAELVAELRRLYDQRNATLHRGSLMDDVEATRACQAARDTLELVPRVLRRLHALPAGAGLAHAVAALLDGHIVCQFLERADLAIRARDYEQAVAEAAAAIDALYNSAMPAIPRASAWGRPRNIRGVDNTDLNDAIRNSAAAIAALQAWMAPLALGVSPARYARLSAELALVIQVDGGFVAHPPREPATMETARRTLEYACMTAVRLWQLGSLRPVEHKELVVKLQPRS